MYATYDSEIESIAQTVFSTMLNIDLERTSPPDIRNEAICVGAIQITGGWVGCITLSLCTSAADAAAAAMLQMAPDEVTEADRFDVIGELANVIGGNLKSILPGPSDLSLPTVVSGTGFDLKIPSTEMIDDVWLRWGNGFLRVAVFTKVGKTHS